MRPLIALLWIVVGLSANQECASCHPDAAKACRKSPHYTLKHAINITRQAWGIREGNVTLQTLPVSKTTIAKPADLVDDFLRRKCLKCHVSTPGDATPSRSTDCLACHTPHNTTGTCQSAPVSTERCQQCHARGYTSSEYSGLFPKDHHRAYRAPLDGSGHFPPQSHGIDYHHLSEDIHHRAGIRCAQCHTALTLRGDKRASCTDCHTHLSPAHHPRYHARIACSACHASWGYSAYELSVFRDDTADYGQWKDLTVQEDSYLTTFLTRALASKEPIPPRMPDWLTRQMHTGIWYSGYRYKRWEDAVLANYDDGRIGLVRPLYQYRISYRDANGTMILDDTHSIDGRPIEAWVPYAPHTIAPRAKSCEQCHANPLITNPYRGDNTVLQLKVPKRLIGASPLSPKQIKRMTSRRYKQERAKRFGHP
jgi:hypothetical protein